MALINYGYDAEDWDNQPETKKQVVRNTAWEQFKEGGGIDTADGDRAQKLRDSLIIGEQIQAYDNFFGTRTNYNTFSERYFPNTKASLNRERYGIAENQIDYRRGLGDLNKPFVPENNSYSGCDITPSITVGDKTFVIGNISTISYSVHRAKTPVRTLGRAYPKSYVSSSRTIAGTLIFNVFDTHVLHDIRKAVITEVEANGNTSSPLTDQLPPFDVTIVFSNEYGARSYMRIYALEISDEGQTHSINDIYSENVMQYVARDIDLMVKEGDSWSPQGLAFSNSTFQGNLQTPATEAATTSQYWLNQIGEAQEMLSLNNQQLRLIKQYIASATAGLEDGSFTDTDTLLEQQKQRDKLKKENVDLKAAIEEMRKKAVNAEMNVTTSESYQQTARQQGGSKGSYGRTDPYRNSRGPKPL